MARRAISPNADVRAANAKAGSAGRDNGPPRSRPHCQRNYHGAFAFDPDGNDVEAVCHDPE